MSQRLQDNLTNDYLGAAQRLNGLRKRRCIIAYVEGYDDIFFWRSLLNELETEEAYFEVMLPSRHSLQKGKKVALMTAISRGLGPNLIVCCDADYDFLQQGSTGVSKMVCNNPYVFHTHVYAIENFQCYAPSLHTVCVMATLNDHSVFDFEAFMTAFSQIVFPLFVWSIWCYRYGFFGRFSMADMANVVQISDASIHNPNQTLEKLRNRVRQKASWLQNHLQAARGTYKEMEQSLLKLGVTPENTYLYMRGHDVFEKVVYPLVGAVCRMLTSEREREIQKYAYHSVQRKNELAGYEHSSAGADEMMRKQTDYKRCPEYRFVQDEVRRMLERKEPLPNSPVWDPDDWMKNENNQQYR